MIVKHSLSLQRQLLRGLIVPTHRTFSTTTKMATHLSQGTSNAEALASFHAHLLRSERILALLGAGISASSGLPTFRGAGGLWRNHDATRLATPGAFSRDPSLVWQFYNYRRHMALNAKPNRAHLALAEFARRNPQFVTLSQNVDGLSPRANHPEEQLKLLHGNLFDLKCIDRRKCRYEERNNFTDPVVPALALPAQQTTSIDAQQANTNPLIRGSDIASSSIPLTSIPLHDLPRCPKCKENLLRPGVVWFGESLPWHVVSSVDEYLNAPKPIDLILVIGTSSAVHPAAGYTQEARDRGARVCVVNMDPGDARDLDLDDDDGSSKSSDDERTSEARDWLFLGDAANIVPVLLEPIVGEIAEFKE